MTFAEQVELLLSQAQPHAFYRQTVAGIAPSVIGPRACIGIAGPNTYVAGPGESELISEPARLLALLYAGASPAEQKSFSGILLRRLNQSNARVIARSLVVAGQLHALPAGDELATWEELWRGLIHAMRYESQLFAESDLQAVEAAAAARLQMIFAAERERAVEAQRTRDALPSVGSSGLRRGAGVPVRYSQPRHGIVDEAKAVIDRIRYLRLAKTIREQRNPTVDVDRQRLLSRMQALGFSAKLSEASDDIEERLVGASTEFDVKGVMDLVRTFLEEVVEEACRKIEAKVGKAAPVAGKGSLGGNK